jgi:hypothetical protein
MTAPRVSETGAQALWALYRAGVLTTLGQWAFVDNDGRVKGQTIKSLAVRELAHVVHKPPLRVTSGERVYSSVMQWEATLTRAGQEWIAQQIVKTEGLPTRGKRPTV